MAQSPSSHLGVEGGGRSGAGWNAGGPGGLGSDGSCNGGLVCSLRGAGSGGSGRLVRQGVFRHKASSDPRAAMLGFFGWEIAKIVLTVALLAAAPRLVPDLSWMALLIGMVITMKTYWAALLVRSGVRKTD